MRRCAERSERKEKRFQERNQKPNLEETRSFQRKPRVLMFGRVLHVTRGEIMIRKLHATNGLLTPVVSLKFEKSR